MILENHADVLIRIEKQMRCTPVSLYLYSDNTYELFTDYDTCRPFQECTMKLHYKKSIKGTYNYDLTKILDNSIEGVDIDYKAIDYEILTGSTLGGPILGEKYDHDYVIKKGESNKYLEEFLNIIDVDLNMCAIPNYY